MSRWWILLAIPLNYVGINLIFTLLLLASGFHTFKFASSSMEPTLFANDKFVVDSRYYKQQSANRNDLVLLRTGDAVTVKRIIAIGGDTIEGKQREIFLNNQIREEPFVQHKFKAGPDPALDTFGPIKIPPGKYFLMGDNRDISLDSRTPSFGLIDAAAVVGRPLYGYQIMDKPHHWDLQ
jgi:signal peptidase I